MKHQNDAVEEKIHNFITAKTAPAKTIGDVIVDWFGKRGISKRENVPVSFELTPRVR